jgi:hypothetical protein
MPAGTVKVDVSDVYDWYKLGQHISNMKGLGKHDFGSGPPASIISFGDEDTEHKFIQDLKRTGLDVTDIDPRDPVKRPGKTIKTDPTYNVNEDTESYPDVLYHGSTQEIKGPLTPRQAHDIGGAAGSNKNAIYATDDPNFAIAYSLAQRGSDTGTLGWKKDPRLIFFGGKIRRGQNVYLHVLPTRDAQGQPLFTKGAADAEWHSLPNVKSITPLKVETKPVDQYLHLLRKPTPEEQKMFLANKAKDQQAIKEDQQLDEVKMSPSALQQWANSDAAKGIRAGFEAELIFRDTTNDDDDDGEIEPDYDYDERARSVSQGVIDFFNGGDYGGLGPRQENALQDGLDQQYMEWHG